MRRGRILAFGYPRNLCALPPSLGLERDVGLVRARAAELSRKRKVSWRGESLFFEEKGEPRKVDGLLLLQEDEETFRDVNRFRNDGRIDFSAREGI